MKKKLLVLENDPDLLELLVLLLTDSGYKVTGTANDLDFFELIKKTDPDVILLDVVHITPLGTKLCKALKEHPEFQHIPIVVLSTHSQVAETKKICADDIIKKPFDIDYLLSVIEEQFAA